MRFLHARLRQRTDRALPSPVLGIIRQRYQLSVVQILRSTAAATLAYVAASGVVENPLPLTAPLTALLVVQVTLYATLRAGIRRMLSVMLGVLLAVWFVDLLGFSWWSLGLLILACQTGGHLLRLHPWVPEVAISGMLVLGVGAAAPATAMGRFIETVIGASVGMLFNMTVIPPVFVQPANEALQDLARRLRDLLLRVSDELRRGASREETDAWLREARALDGDIWQVDSAITRAEEGLRLNPRSLLAPHTAMFLRSGLDTLEHCTVTLRALARSLADLAQERGEGKWVYGGEIATSFHHLLARLADAIDAFGHLITAEVTTGAERLEADLSNALEEARQERERIATLLWLETGNDPETWELHGSLLASVDRLLNELDLEKRLQWRLEMQSTGQGVLRRTRRRIETHRERLNVAQRAVRKVLGGLRRALGVTRGRA